ncbi:MAG: glycosyltransferase, partial [Planctomycetes bacterium]|nr:glycosyltransferase [Planctomycetota bacterium]
MPTRNRPRALAASLEALGRLGGNLDRAAEVIVVDNASEPPAAVAPWLANGIPVRSIRLSENEAAASR